MTDRPKAFTLIEVLVVVGIIALLVAVLIPSLIRAREQAKLVIDEANLKEIGKAIPMYVLDHRDKFPGPVHPAMLRFRTGYTDKQQNFYLPNLLRKYFSEASRTKSNTTIADKIATCPSFPVSDDAFTKTSVDPFHYVIQTGSWTKTPYYFGFAHGGLPDMEAQELRYPGPKYKPKNVGVIRQPAREWLVADGFERPWRSGEYPATYPGLPRGSWGIEDDNVLSSGKVLPKSPFHLGNGCERRSPASVYKGKVSTLFADWHAEAALWKGTLPQNEAVAP